MFMKDKAQDDIIKTINDMYFVSNINHYVILNTYKVLFYQISPRFYDDDC